ncbi:FmdB family zinc ribbon protein [Agarilytica rhodophyticola]|uniref:FmdB family zinc ribbon protein n=1 Tax=Agarilytica rhodophyticola TaxID=1737490 RepID=UPI000B345920|nr:zinc ribbon domain-containing protein [Agarilytica rhodophyticola]
MPIYEYKCEHCGHEFEALQKMSDEPLLQCPKCKNEALKKKVSAAAFRLKGGGWYETDFKSGNKKNLVSGDKPAETSAKKEGTSSTDSNATKATSAGATSKKTESS